MLGEVFNCLHRAQLGSAAARSPDPGLPQIVRVPKPGSSSSLTGMATPTDPSSRQQGANSMVQDIFGQKVQVRLPYNAATVSFATVPKVRSVCRSP